MIFMYKSPPTIKGLNFTNKEIKNARKNNKLLSFDLELSRLCNIKCIYCYTKAGNKLKGEMSLKDIFSTIKQAMELGIKIVVIVGGGEPLIYKDYFKVIDYINQNKLDSITFTNGTKINDKMSKLLSERKISLCVKLNSLNPSIHDKMCGVRGVHKKIMSAFNLLLDIGYTQKNMPQLCLESIVCKYNYNDIKNIWIWARERNIVPYIELPTIQGRAKERIMINPRMAEKLFTELRKIDNENYGFDWPITSPIAAQICKRHYFSCYITSKGDVQPCAGIEISIGNIKKDRLEDILKNSLEIKILRTIDKNIQGKCKSCINHPECYGCRGKAFQKYKDFTMSDPSCWYNYQDDSND